MSLPNKQEEKLKAVETEVIAVIQHVKLNKRKEKRKTSLARNNLFHNWNMLYSVCIYKTTVKIHVGLLTSGHAVSGQQPGNSP